jgi:hypothetical protein
MPDNQAPQVGFGNYLVAFIDLLGQREALRGQGILPSVDTPDAHDAFKQTAIRSVGAILALHRTSEDVLKGYENRNFDHLREVLPPDSHEILDDLAAGSISTQRWSDGLVHYYCMRGSNVVRDLAAYYALFTRTGSTALIGLARQQPVRGGIEVSWGVELHKNELYGAAVANAYEIESSVAQYPRIVIGKYAIDYLRHVSQQPGDSIRTRFERGFATEVLDLTFQDYDGSYCVHYLSYKFMEGPDSPHMQVVPAARAYIQSQLTEHRDSEKLRLRYEKLRDYFDRYAP